MKSIRTLLFSLLLAGAATPAAAADKEPASPLVLGQHTIARLYAGQEAEIVQGGKGWKVERTSAQISLSNSDYAKTYSVDSAKFADRIELTQQLNDSVERYVLFVSAPNEHSRIIYKIQRTIEYPKRLARPRADAFTQALANRWGAVSYAAGLPLPKPSTRADFVWFFERDGTQIDMAQGCAEALATSEAMQVYDIAKLADVAKTENARCNAYVKAGYDVDDAGFVSKATFEAYSNLALFTAMQEDESMLRTRLEAYLDQNVRERRRVLNTPQL